MARRHQPADSARHKKSPGESRGVYN